jgi:hypothetical protein
MPDEEIRKGVLRFIDKDIRDNIFEREVPVTNQELLMAQLCKDIKDLTLALRAFKAELDDPTA